MDRFGNMIDGGSRQGLRGTSEVERCPASHVGLQSRRYSSSRAYLVGPALDGSNGTTSTAYGVAHGTANGNVFITGSLSAPLNFGGGPLVSADGPLSRSQDVFIVA